MRDADLNLLAALDVLLAEGSVTRAARRLGLSESAMSRTLTRLRVATGDPLLVRAGRRLVPTPRADALRDQVHALAREVRAVLRPHSDRLDLRTLDVTFTLRASEGFLQLLSGRVSRAITDAAPHVRLRFAAKADWDAHPLREGAVDLEIGLAGKSAPEIRTQLLFHDALIGVVRSGHELVGTGEITPRRYASCGHVAASRGEHVSRALDAALGRLGLERRIVVEVPGYPDAMRIVRSSDLVTAIPRSCLGNSLVGDQARELGLHSFALPVAVAGFSIAAMWHPSRDPDPAHRWLRKTVVSTCRQAYARPASAVV